MKLKDIFMYALGAIVCFGFFAVLFYLIYKGEYESTLNLAIGSLIGAFGTVVGYFYGSSKGSSEKNDMINAKKGE